ncbi:MAG: hypothetical protein QXU11_10700 [Thermoproteota archaeon]
MAHGEVKVGDFRILEIEGTEGLKILKTEEVKEKPIPVAKEQALKPQCPICCSVGTLKYMSTFRSSSKHSELEAKCTRCGLYFRVVARRTIGLQWEIVSIKPIFRERETR